MRDAFKGRVDLSAKASEAINFMVNQLKEESSHVQISHSKLCSWIIENYARDHFSSESKRIIENHFNPKRYLTEMLKGAKTENEIMEALKSVQGHFQGTAQRNRPHRAKLAVQVAETKASAENGDQKVN